MVTRLENVVLAARDIHALGRFWSQLLGWEFVADESGEVDVRAPASQGWLLDLVFEPVESAKTGKNRLHLDLASRSAEDQAAIVRRAGELGAKPVDIGQRGVPWEVMADPEGNEFCVLDPRDGYADSGALAAIVVDSVDAAAAARFWVEATGWSVATRTEGGGVGLRAPNGRGPWLEFLTGFPAKTGPNRVHLDVRPRDGEDHQAEIRRLAGHGARPIDIGQGDVPWEVMADPEDNEFCVLAPRGSH